MLYIQKGLTTKKLKVVNADTSDFDVIKNFAPKEVIGDLNNFKRTSAEYCICGYIQETENGEYIRNNENLIRRTLIFIDLDDLSSHGEINRIASLLGEYQYMVYPTISCTEDNPRYRLVIEPSRPLNDKNEYDYMIDAISNDLSITYDNTSKTWSQCQGLPIVTEFNKDFKPIINHGEPYPVPDKIDVKKEVKPFTYTVSYGNREGVAFEHERAIQLVRQYVNKNKDELKDYNNALSGIMVIGKSFLNKEIGYDTAVECVRILAMGDSEYENNNMKKLNRELAQAKGDASYFNTQYTFLQKFRGTQPLVIHRSDDEDEPETIDTYRIIQNLRRNPDNDNKIEKGSYNVDIILQHLNGTDVIAYNEFTGKVDKISNTIWGTKKGWWSDEDTDLFIHWCETYLMLKFKKEDVERGVLAFAKDNSYHPIKKRIEQVEWDNTHRAETFFIELLGCEDNQYTREVTRKWLSGLVARTYEPGCEFKIVPILVGGQSIGKSTVCRRLMPDYYTDNVRGFGERDDDYRMLETVSIVELGELKGLARSTIENVKSFLSARSDIVRAPYGRHHKKVDRHCVFIGTSNAKSFLKDDTGESRFYPLKCEIQAVDVHPMDKDEEYFLQVLAEAKTWYDNGEVLRLSDNVLQLAEEVHGEFKVEDAIKDKIVEFLNMPLPIEWEELNMEQRKTQYRAFYEHVNIKVPWLVKENAMLLQVTSVNEIAYVVFNEDPTSSNYGKHSMHGIIRDKMDNMPNWKKGTQKYRLYKKSMPTTVYHRQE